MGQGAGCTVNDLQGVMDRLHRRGGAGQGASTGAAAGATNLPLLEPLLVRPACPLSVCPQHLPLALPMAPPLLVVVVLVCPAPTCTRGPLCVPLLGATRSQGTAAAVPPAWAWLQAGMRGARSPQGSATGHSSVSRRAAGEETCCLEVVGCCAGMQWRGTEQEGEWESVGLCAERATS